LRLSAERHLLLFTSHHVLLDGWSTPILFRELLTLYRSAGDATVLPQVRPYTAYLAWLAAQDQKQALKAWQAYLAGFDAPSNLSGPGRGAPVAIVPARCQRTVSAEVTAQVQALA